MAGKRKCVPGIVCCIVQGIFWTMNEAYQEQKAQTGQSDHHGHCNSDLKCFFPCKSCMDCLWIHWNSFMTKNRTLRGAEIPDRNLSDY